MSKCLAIRTENGLEKIARANDVATAVKLAILQKQASQGLNYNTKKIITESGEWTATASGYYKTTLMGGGSGGVSWPGASMLKSGNSGSVLEKFIYLEKGQKVPVTIGAGGNAVTVQGEISVAGETSFGEFTTQGMDNSFPGREETYTHLSSSESIALPGAGRGGAYTSGWTANDPRSYGAGGSAAKTGSTITVSDGYQGCVIIEYFDPDKAALPTINDNDLIPFVDLLQRVDALEKALAESRMYNTEEWLTESGEYEVPVTGDYEVSVWAGGNGAAYSSNSISGYAGEGKAPLIALRKYTKGEVIPVTIGAAGLAAIAGQNDVSEKLGGVSSFGDIVHNNSESLTIPGSQTYIYSISPNTVQFIYGYGGGIGGGFNGNFNAKNYGAGGGLFYNYDDPSALTVGNGYQGAVRLRYYDQNK